MDKASSSDGASFSLLRAHIVFVMLAAHLACLKCRILEEIVFDRCISIGV